VNVQAILAARIDRLAPDDKRLLQTATVIGKDVPLSVLQAVAEESYEALQGSLGRLQAAEFLYEARLFPDTEYTFKHALTYEVAYGGLLHERRRDLHRRTLLALKTSTVTDGGDAAERLAHHAQQAELWEDAVTYARQCGEKAVGRSAFREAARHVEQAVRAIERLPDSVARTALAIDTRLQLRGPLWQIGRYDDALRILREAETLAQGLEDFRRLAWVRVWLFNLFWLLGRAADWRPLVEEVRRAMDFADDVALQIAAANQFAQACWNMGDFTLMRDVLEAFLPIADGSSSVRTPAGFASAGAIVTYRALLGGVNAELGYFEQAEQHSRDARRIAKSSGSPFLILYATTWAAYVCLMRGDFAQAAELAEPLLHMAQEYELTVTLPGVHVALGIARVGLGQVESGLDLAEQGLTLTERSDVRMYEVLWVVMIAEACLIAGKFARAEELSERALRLARERSERGVEARALHIIGGVSAARGPSGEKAAENSWCTAIALATELGNRSLLPHCHLGLGQLYRKTGRSDEARAHTTTAVTMLRDMDMTYWLEKAEAGLRELR
jgi:tetratricopeptide (TPR) repeat protein